MKDQTSTLLFGFFICLFILILAAGCERMPKGNTAKETQRKSGIVDSSLLKVHDKANDVLGALRDFESVIARATAQVKQMATRLETKQQALDKAKIRISKLEQHFSNQPDAGFVGNKGKTISPRDAQVELRMSREHYVEGSELFNELKRKYDKLIGVRNEAQRNYDGLAPWVESLVAKIRRANKKSLDEKEWSLSAEEIGSLNNSLIDAQEKISSYQSKFIESGLDYSGKNHSASRFDKAKSALRDLKKNIATDSRLLNPDSRTKGAK